MHVADRFVQAARLGVAQGQRSLVMGQCFGIGIEAAGMVAGQGETGRSVGVLPGQPEVPADLRGLGSQVAAEARPLRQRPGRAAVQQPAAGQARLVVDQAAQLLMGEVVARGRAGVLGNLSDDPPVGQYLQR